jgi:hypothetical protein
MTVSRASMPASVVPRDPAIASLQASTTLASTAQALRTMKNQLIGNKHKKVAFLNQGAVPMIIAAAEANASVDVWIQAAAALASLAYKQPAAVSEIRSAGGVQLFMRMLASEDDKVVENAARALMVTVKVCACRGLRRLRRLFGEGVFAVTILQPRLTWVAKMEQPV